MNNTLKNIAIWALIGLLAFLILDFYKANETAAKSSPISYSQFLQDVKDGNVSKS